MPRVGRKTKIQRRQMEGLTRAQAQAVCDDIDEHHGYPKKGNFGAGAQHLEAACDEWLAAYQTNLGTMAKKAAIAAAGPPPPGITTHWADPDEHPTEAGNFSVPVDENHGHETRLMQGGGKTLGGRKVSRADFRKRGPGWRRPDPAELN